MSNVNYDFDLPDFDKVSEEDLIDLAQSYGHLPRAKVRAQIIHIIYEILGYNLEPDLFYFLIDETEKQLCLAPAGGGKTTTMCIKIILQQLWRKLEDDKLVSARSIVCLVYNKANINDVKKRHSELLYQLKTSGVKGFEKVETGIKVCTVHSFCQEWLSMYEGLAGIVGYRLVTDDSSKNKLMESAIKQQIKKHGNFIEQDKVSTSKLLELYNYLRETMMPYERMTETDKFIDLNLPVEFIQSCFETYDAVKKMTRQYDFTDSLTMFYDLIKNHEEVRERIQRNYSYFTADEVQDLTPIIMKIIVLLTEGKPLVCIGDEDQCIYSFRGANPKNILKFNNIFKNSRIFLLRTNRRCPDKIVDMAKSVISLNHNRFDKEILSLKTGGSIKFKSYRDRLTQFDNVIKLVEGMSEDERNNTCISYRNSATCVTIADAFIEKGIHFHILKGLNPFDYPLYKAVREVMQALQAAVSKKALCSLYKALPLKRAELAEFLGYDLQKDKPKDGKDFIRMEDVDFGKRGLNPNLSRAWKFLIFLRDHLKDEPLKNYFPMLLNNIRDYYWNFRVKSENRDLQVDSAMTHSVLNYYMKNKSYMERNQEYENQIRVIKRDAVNYNGVALSTFHSQKGLEWDNVIMVDLQESIYPNIPFIESKPYPQEVKEELLETEVRLFYVAITRSKKNLWLFYSAEDPTNYVTYLINKYRKEEEDNKDSNSRLSNLNSMEISKVDETNPKEDEIIDLSLDSPSGKDDNGLVSIEEVKTVKLNSEDIIVKSPLGDKETKVNLAPQSNNFKNMLRGRFLK